MRIKERYREGFVERGASERRIKERYREEIVR